MSEQIVSLFGQLLKLNLKQFQDNFRLKKFCNNHGNFLQNYVNSQQRRNQRNATQASKDGSWTEICEHFVQNYSNVESELFNEYNSIKAMLTKMNYFDYSKFDESQNGFEEILFGQTQSLMILLDSDNTKNFVMLKKFLQTWLKSDENNKPSIEFNSKSSLISNHHRHHYRCSDDEQEEQDGSDEIGLELIESSQVDNNDENHDHRAWTYNNQQNSPLKKFSLLEPSSKKIFHCKFCSVKYSVIKSLIRHLANEHNSNFQCANCNKRFHTHVQFSVHLRKRLCFLGVRSKPSGHQHLSVKDSNISQQQQQNILDSSSSTSKQVGATSALEYGCPNCSESFTKQSHLAQHIQTFHSKVLMRNDEGDQLLTDDEDELQEIDNENKFQMSFHNRFDGTPTTMTPNIANLSTATKILRDKKKLLQKLKESDAIEIPNNDESSQQGIGDFFCCVCNLDFTRSYYLVDHIEESHIKNCCVGCNRQFKSRTTLNRHVKESSCTNRSPLRQHVCNFCVLTFKRENHLYQHILRRHGNDPKLVELVMKNYDDEDDDDNNGDESQDLDNVNGATNGEDDEDDDEYDEEINGNKNGFDYFDAPDGGGSGGDQDEIEELNNYQLNSIEKFMEQQQTQMNNLDSSNGEPNSKIKSLACPECNLTFAEISEFVLHLERHHLTENGKFECFECRTLFKSRQNMSRHVRESYCYNFPERPFQCKICNRDFKRNSHLSTHINRVHPDYMQTIMDRSTNGKPLADDLMMEDDEPEMDVSKLMQTSMTTGCPNLVVELSDSEDEKNGSNGRNGGSASAEGELNDDEQEDKMNKKTEIISWDPDSSNVDNDLKCRWPDCTFVGTASKQVSQHWKLDHLGWNAATGRFKCSNCSEEFELENDCSRHWRLKHYSAMYRCNLETCGIKCEFKTASRQQLVEHREKSHARLKCDFASCDKTFRSRTALTTHMRRMHQNELVCPWPECSDSFKRPDELRAHLSTHYGAKHSYRCNLEGCEASFRNQGGLYLHRKRHEQQQQLGLTPSQPFVDTMFECCWPDCKRRFGSQSQLNSHFESHTGPNTIVVAADPNMMSLSQHHHGPDMLLSPPPPPLVSFSSNDNVPNYNLYQDYQSQQQPLLSPGSTTSSSSSSGAALPMIHPSMMMSSELMLTNSCPIPHCYTNFENPDLLQQHIESVHMQSMYSNHIN